MALFVDARVPLRFGSVEDLESETAILIEGDGPAPAGAAVARFTLADEGAPHGIACECCAPRGPVEQALGRLFLARARGDVPFFRAVVAHPLDERGAAAIRRAVEEDPLVSGCYRLTTPI